MVPKGLLIKPSGEAKDVFFDDGVTLADLQKCVEGYIEIIWLKGGKVLIVNEEGKINGLEKNMRATYLVQEHGLIDFIVGNALLIESKYIN